MKVRGRTIANRLSVATRAIGFRSPGINNTDPPGRVYYRFLCRFGMHFK
jgi:hypothetical protein